MTEGKYYEKFSERKVATKYERDLKILNKKIQELYVKLF